MDNQNNYFLNSELFKKEKDNLWIDSRVLPSNTLIIELNNLRIGEALVKEKKVTGFTNGEEDAVQLTSIVPFLVEDMLKENGGIEWIENINKQKENTLLNLLVLGFVLRIL